MSVDAQQLRDGLALILLVLQLGQSIPVISRLSRRRHGAGASLVTEAIWCVSGFGWVVMGYQDRAWPLAVSGVLAVLCSGVIATKLIPLNRSEHRHAATAAAGVGMLILAALALAGQPGLTVALAAISAVQFIPQLLLSVRALRRRTRTPGVSIAGSHVRTLYLAAWAAWSIGPIWGTSQTSAALTVWGVTGAIAYSAQAIVAARSRLPQRTTTATATVTSARPRLVLGARPVGR